MSAPARRRSSVALVALVATVASAAPAAAGAPRWWLGPSFAGLPLTHAGPRVQVYGACRAESDSGCSPPLQVQSWTTCERNPVGLDVLSRGLRRVRDAAVLADYGAGAGLNLMTGHSTVTVFANRRSLGRRALPALRRRSQRAPSRRLAPPRFPPAVLRELKRALVARREFGSLERASDAIGLSRPVLRTRLRLARLLPSRHLRDVEAPRRSVRAVERDRQVAFQVLASGVERAAERFALTERQVRRTVRRVRGLVPRC